MSDHQKSGLLPDGLIPVAFEGFSSLNTNASRPGIKADEMWWCDGFMPVGPNFLRTLYGIGEAIFTGFAAGSVVFFDFGNIGSTPYCLVFQSDGRITVFNANTGASRDIAGAGTIENPSALNCGITQWGSSYIIIVSVQTNGYFVWDGTTFYLPGDTIPAFPDNPVPTGISGTAAETYQSRVWVANGATVNFTAPGSITDFTTEDGGGDFTSGDSFLRVSYIQPRQTNGFLYLIGDSSVNYIGGVSTSGNPPTTVFTNQNSDPEVGTPWPATVEVAGSNIIFANAFGAQVSYGGRVGKISTPLDGVYNSVPNFGGLVPSAAKAIIFGKKIWILLLPVIDTVTGQQVNKLFMWDTQGGKAWWSSDQDVALIFIASQEINSVLTAWGTDGTSIYQLFAQPSTGFTKTLQSKLWPVPAYFVQTTAGRLWGLTQYFSAESPDLTISVDNETGQSPQTVTASPNYMTWVNEGGAAMTWENDAGQTMTWGSSGLGIIVLPPTPVGQQGFLLGLTVETNAADMALISLTIGAVPWAYTG